MPPTKTRPPFDAAAVQLKDILFSEESQAHVPEYQREFSWEKAQLEPFWEDLVSPQSPNGRFAGTFLLMEADETGSQEIVDGQQRATVATLLLAALRQVAVENKHLAIAKQIQRLDIQIEDPDTGELGKFRLRPSRSCLRYVEQTIQSHPPIELEPGTREEKRIAKAFSYFQRQIESSIKGLTREDALDVLKGIRAKTRDLRFVRITVYKPELKFEIFESVNARGLNLSPADLIKNYLISKNPTKQASIADEWQEAALTAEEFGMPMTDVIRYHWNGTHKFVSVKALFDAIKGTATTPERTLALLSSIQEAVLCLQILQCGTVEELRSGFQGNKKHGKSFQQSVELLRQLGTKQHLALFLALFRHRELLPAGLVAQAADLVVRFSVAHFGLCQGPGNRVERFFSKSARGIAKAVEEENPKKRNTKAQSALQSVISGLNERWPADTQVIEALSQLQYEPDRRTKSLLRTIFATLEFSRPGGGEANMDWSVLNIEHIQPQNPIDPSEIPEFQEVVHSLGNLTLLFERTNQQLGNKVPSDKAVLLKKSVLGITREVGDLIQEKGWTPYVISERTESFVSEAKGLFLGNHG